MANLARTEKAGRNVAHKSQLSAIDWLPKAIAISAAALLSACATSHPNLSPTQQAADYAAHAHGNYAPPGPPNDPWGPYIREASKRFDVPQAWIRGVMHVESGGHEYMNGHLIVSPTGAMGLMQVEPETYQEMEARYNLGSDPYNPYNNIMAGTAYIHEMYEIYGSPGFLAAYNAGPGRLDDYLDYKEPLPQATRTYVAMIAPQIQGVYPATPSSAAQLAMNQLPNQIPKGRRPYTSNAVDIAYRSSASVLSSAKQPSPAIPPVRLPRPEPIQVATLTPPPLIEPEKPTPHAPEAPPPLNRGGFPFIQSAEAASPIPSAPRLTTSGPWAIQVGAYNSVPHAKAALGIAELSAVRMLIRAQPVVQTINTARGTLYRARFLHLSHGAAVKACERLDNAPTGCAVLSPEAQ